ncbi:hypothetical protein POM88_017665 [Heracleum sosnowskyi]|uniref:Uncharacterized protein n=1 Tax=Heracleum sosnowskyi TaxID=360622 RepID=A0AAD8IS82_9APIA|nr:hypothetical protein POM88_017665 [Heracleum sosnowskyi]
MAAKRDKELREELEVKKGEQEKDDFTVVHRKGKEKMGFSRRSEPGFLYTGRRGFKGETSGVNKVSILQNNKSILQNNKFNLLDNLEAVSTRVEVKRDEKLIGSSVVESGTQGRQEAVDKAGRGGNKSKMNANERIEVHEEVEKCDLNTETEVDSDEDDTARFMVEDRSLNVHLEPGSESDEDGDNTLDREAFVIEQVFGEIRKGVERRWDNKIGLCGILETRVAKSMVAGVFNKLFRVMGDFNAMLKVEENDGGTVGNSLAISGFCNCVTRLEVMDLHFSGILFTWSGSPHGVGVIRKLDRALVNGALSSKFHQAKARFLAPKSSDNSPGKDLQLRLQNVQIALDCDPFNESLKSKEIHLAKEYMEASLEEERMLKQKLKIHWLKVGDQSNKKFHKSLQVKRNRNRISSILNDKGAEVEGELMVEQFVSFYKGLLGKRNSSDNIDYLLDHFDKKVSANMCEAMIQEITDEEIKGVIFSMDDLFLFSHGDPWYVQILKDVLDEFGAASGIWPNEDKSSTFFCNVSTENQMLINNIMRFEIGVFPVKYLGVPLIATRLWHADCSPLIEQVKSQIQKWQNTSLTYAGRLQLALSVLISLQV